MQHYIRIFEDPFMYISLPLDKCILCYVYIMCLLLDIQLTCMLCTNEQKIVAILEQQKEIYIHLKVCQAILSSEEI